MPNSTLAGARMCVCHGRRTSNTKVENKNQITHYYILQIAFDKKYE